MNKALRGWICCLLGGACILSLLAVALKQPGGDDEDNAPVSFSVPSGFYDDAFSLELDAGQNEIYYTLDSSDPDTGSMRYTGPILIKDASENENVYCLIEDVSPYNDVEMLERNGFKRLHEYKIPQKPVDKVNVVKAVSVDDQGNCSRVVEAVYFVGFKDKKGYDGINIMTITTDPDNLFSRETGIYVMGKTFDDNVVDGIVQYEVNNANALKTNYRQKGKEWERRATIHCFNPNGNMIFSGDFGIRIQGNTTRAKLPKSMNLYARKEYGQTVFDTGQLFAPYNNLKSLNLHSSLNGTMFKDYLACEFIEGLDVTCRKYVPCALFLDGEYWGIYWLSPRFKADYMEQVYGVEEKNLFLVKQNRIEIGYEEDRALLDELVEYITGNDMSLAENYQHVSEMIDMQSYIKYFAYEIYIANTDWPEFNQAMWRTKYRASDTYSDCKWRWILFDVDNSMDAKNAQKSLLKNAINRDAIFASLVENKDFVAALNKQLLVLAKDTFSSEKVDAFVDDYKALMAEPMVLNYQRFMGNDKTLEDFIQGCDDTKVFFHKRQKYILKQYGRNGYELQ